MDNTVEKKKRGRKPKSDKIITPKVPQKRGRKPKDKYGINTQKINTNIDEHGSIILHLPVFSDDIKDNFGEKDILKYDPAIKSPKPYDMNMMNQQYAINSPYPFDSDTIKKEKAEQVTLNTDSDIISEYNTSKNSNINSNTSSNISSNMSSNISSNMSSDMSSHMSSHMSSNIIDNNIITDNTIDSNCQYNSNDSDKCIKSYDYLSSNTSKVFQLNDTISDNPDNVLCHWCCHTFNNKPVGLPINYRNNKFEIIGHFCSPECACAYNFDSVNIFNDIWYRYTLLNYMCSILYNKDNISIKKAGSRYILNSFGGPLSINEFRKSNINYSVDYQILNPPLISILSQINEIHINKFTHKFIPIDKDRIKTASNELKLKRSKPITEKKNTLENCMNLTYM